MSLTEIRPYFRTRFNALGYSEWQDAFNIENVPESIIDGSYHIEAFEIPAKSLNQTDLQLEPIVITKLVFLGFRYPSEALDKAMEALDDIYVEVLLPANRLEGTGGLRNVLLIDTNIEPLNFDNDNGILITIRWRCQVNLCTT